MTLYKDVLSLKKINLHFNKPNFRFQKLNFKTLFLRNPKKLIYPALIALFAILFFVSGGILADYFVESQQQQSQMEELSDIVEQIQQQMQEQIDTNDGTSAPLSVYVQVTNPETGDKINVLREYAKIYAMNPDVAGWIKIPGTRVNYPVMQTPGRTDFYLKRDFNKVSGRHGSIYACEDANLSEPSDNITIYGHRMADGTMFADLHNYRDKAFFDQYPLVQFDTLTEHHTYQICYIFVMSASEESAFAYHTFVDGTELEFNYFVSKCKELALYDTGAEVVYGDKLITLSTCDHDIDNGRLVVVARRLY